MFSGIVEEVAVISGREERGGSVFLTVRSALNLADTRLGDSVCIEGVCLTVIEINGAQLRFEVGAESLRRTTLGSLQIGANVNFERSLRLNDRLHGHFVSGHIDGRSELISTTIEGDNLKMVWKVPSSIAALIAAKGSVSLAGVSLTVGERSGDTFAVYLIRHTLDHTTLAARKVGETVNIEADLLARYVAQLVGSRA